MKEKFKEVPIADGDVPGLLRLVVDYLNELLAVDAGAVTRLLDQWEILVDGKAFEEALPQLVLRSVGPHGVVALTGLGILTGFCNSENFRLFAEFQNDKKPHGNITRFGVFHVTQEE